MSDADAVDGIDPDVQRFVTQAMADYRRLGAGRDLSPAELREVAEAVRAPWRAGGPPMCATRELRLDTPRGPVRIRIHDPGGAAQKPALVYLHGGGWAIFSIDTHDRVMREYAARAGVVVVGVDYALAPEARYPVALEQVTAVLRWLAHEGADLGIDVDRIAAGGDSAGGNLALAAALALRDAGRRELVKALLLIYPVVDSVCSETATRRYGGPGAMLTAAEMTEFWNLYGGGVDLRGDPLACPLHARLAGLPPVCLTLSSCDVLTEQGVALSERLAAAGVSVDTTLYPGTPHSFIEAVSIAPVAERAIADGARWLRARLRAAAASAGS